MSVIVKGMKMPESCLNCPLETDYGTCGHFNGADYAKHPTEYSSRPVWCPIIELPPHLSEKNDFWKNEYIKEHDARVEEYKNSVPVVRCAFCEHYIKHDKRCTIWNHGVFKNDYCSRGQKKEVEE